MVALYPALLTLLLTSACHLSRPDYKEVSMNSASAAGPVKIRIKNASDMDFDSVHAVFPGGIQVDYGAVPKGGLSAYHATAQAYRYAQISVKAGDRELSLQPIDYVGERALDPGRYTYVLRIEAGRLNIHLETDE
jgi:hypothetical protein